MVRIAVLGLGAMGRRMARRLVAAHHEVVVWSRSGTPEELRALATVRTASSPRAAASEADVVVSMVTDDDASHAVWADRETGALAGLRHDALVIESSTLTPAWVASLGAQVKAAGGRFLDAPVVGSRPQAEAGSLVHLVGGTEEDLARARPVLASWSSAVHHLGPSPSGTVAKLAVNALFGIQVAALERRSC